MMNDCYLGRPAGRAPNLHIEIFLPTINVINVKHCMSFTHSYHFQWTMPYFKVAAARMKQLKLKVITLGNFLYS